MLPELPAWFDFVELAQRAVSFVLLAALFSLLFRVLPARRGLWRDVWVGGALTAAMFTLGKDLIITYVGRTGSSSAYGAAGSLAAVLLWVYYSSLVFLAGASFTHEWARQFGSLRDNRVGGSECLPPAGQKPSPESSSPSDESASSSSSTSTATSS